MPSELYATEPPAPLSVSVSSPVAVSKTLTDWELAGSAGFLKPTARCLPSGLYATEATVDGGPNFVSHGERGLESRSHVFTYPSVSPVVTLPPSRAHATELMPAMVGMLKSSGSTANRVHLRCTWGSPGWSRLACRGAGRMPRLLSALPDPTPGS